MQKVFAELGIPREKIVFISGIGCSSRFPYYMNTYGFHTIHGRAPAFATGLKLARPDLNVWVVTGDGDGLSIGGNHLMHVIRRNVGRQDPAVQQPDLRPDQGPVLADPRARQEDQAHAGGLDRQSAPPAVARHRRRGDLRRPQRRHLHRTTWATSSRRRPAQGTAFVEIYQNCNIFNDGAFDYATDKETKADTRSTWSTASR